MTASSIRWLRFLPRTALEFAANGDALMIFVPVQPWHYSELGVSEQCQLSGPGEIDSKIETFPFQPGAWTVREGLEYCVRSLQMIAGEQNGAGEASAVAHMIAMFEELPERKYGRSQVLLTGLIAQEILIPMPVWQTLLADAETEPEIFHVMKRAAVRCLETRTFDIQPKIYRDWAVGVLSNRVKAPGKRPKNIGLFRLHRTIIALLRVRTH